MKKTAAFIAAMSVLTATPAYSASTFTDMAQYDEATQQAVTYLTEQQIVKGTSATTFSPARNVQRGQVVKMLGRYLEASGKPIPSDWATRARFSDVPVTTSDRELLQYAALVYDEGVFVGNAGKLQPASTLTRENLVLVLSRMSEPYDLAQYAASKGLVSTVSDLASVKEEAKEAVQLFNALAISTVNVFQPKGEVKRIHFASFLAKLLQLIDTVKQPAAELPVAPPVPSEPTIPEEPEAPLVPQEPQPPIVELPVEPQQPLPEERPVEQQPEAPQLPIEVTPSGPDEEEESFIVESDYVEGARVVAVTDTTMTVSHASFGTATFAIDEIFTPLMKESQLWAQAEVTVYVEEDVVTEIEAMTITAAGTAAAPIQMNGALFDGINDLRIASQYATLTNFEEYYEFVTIDAPTNAVYTVSGGEFDMIRANGTLHVTFTGIISHDVELFADEAFITLASTADVASITPSNVFTLTVEDGATVYDVYAAQGVSKATVHGYVETLTVDTMQPFTLHGTGEVNSLYGNAAAIYVTEDGVSVLDVLLDNGVDDVTMQPTL